jgi:hypothetical protein
MDLVARAVGPAFAVWATGQPADAAATASLLYQRLVRVSAHRLAVAAGQAGFTVVCLKGAATGALLYADPDTRPMADLDLLVGPGDLAAMVAWLRDRGFEFAPSRGRGPWGLIGDASFRPMVSADGALNVDLHIQPDAWPLHLGLDGATVRRRARTVMVDGGHILAPCAGDLLLLAASHTARDLFAIDTVKNLVDGLLLVAGRGGAIDWPDLAQRAAAGRMQRPLRLFLGLISELTGQPMAAGTLPATASFHRLADSFHRFDTKTATLAMGWPEKLRREWQFSGDPGVPLHRLRHRLRGLWRPASGLPAGVGATPPV